MKLMVPRNYLTFLRVWGCEILRIALIWVSRKPRIFTTLEQSFFLLRFTCIPASLSHWKISPIMVRQPSKVSSMCSISSATKISAVVVKVFCHPWTWGGLEFVQCPKRWDLCQCKIGSTMICMQLSDDLYLAEWELWSDEGCFSWWHAWQLPWLYPGKLWSLGQIHHGQCGHGWSPSQYSPWCWPILWFFLLVLLWLLDD